MSATAAATPATNGKITCLIDGALCHSVEVHIKDFHSKEWTIDKYREKYPDAPVMSAMAIEKLGSIRAAKARAEENLTANLGTTAMERSKASQTSSRKPFHEIFELGSAPSAMNEKTGAGIPITVYADHDITDKAMIPDLDPNYVFNIELTKTVIIALELNMPMMAWGYHGTGKTSLFDQCCARTGRPFMRVQHTINMEESDVTGQFVVKDGATEFQLGPLPTAMINGYVYCADEYDFAMPSVLSVYQPVLEGKALFIKNAPPALRLIRPHPHFRFVATGNTNGGGDETGLYQGTQIQNAANYSRFKITEEVGYMDEKIEVAVISGQAGIDKKEALVLVKFGNMVREAFKAGKIGSTVSPRELISAGMLGRVRGGKYRAGLLLAFINRLSRVDKEAVNMMAQRLFGEL